MSTLDEETRRLSAMADNIKVVEGDLLPKSTQVVSYDVPIKGVLIAAAKARLETIQSIEIDSDDMMELAATELGEAKVARKGFDAMRLASTKPVRAALDAINDIYSEALDIYEQAEKLCTKNMTTYRAKQLELAAKAKIDAERLAAKERKRLEDEAAKLAQEGKTQEAIATTMVAQAVSVAPVVAAPPKIAGTSFRRNWKCRVVDRRELIVYLAAHPELDQCWEPVMTKFNQMAKAQEAGLAIPGLEAYNDETIASRS